LSTWFEAVDSARSHRNVPVALKTYEPDILAPNSRGVGEGISPPGEAGRRPDPNYCNIAGESRKVRIQNVSRILLSFIVIEGDPRDPST
jgi:hypothetical protein